MEQQLSDLRWRIQSLETKLSWKDEEKRFELAQVAFEHILSVGEHLDGKASRILGAMAFLTAAAAAAIFARAWSPPLPTDDISRKLSIGLEPLFPQLTDEGRTALALQVAAGLAPVRPSVFGFDPALFAFSVYILLVVLGAAFQLTAIGPHLRISPFFADRSGTEGRPRSLVFFDMIARVPRDSWIAHWKNRPVRVLESELVDNFVREVHILSEKLRDKDDLMSWGSFFFRFALMALIAVTGALVDPRTGAYYAVSFGGMALLAMLYAFTDGWRDGKRYKGRIACWVTLAVLWSILGAIGGIRLAT